MHTHTHTHNTMTLDSIFYCEFLNSLLAKLIGKEKCTMISERELTYPVNIMKYLEICNDHYPNYYLL